MRNFTFAKNAKTVILVSAVFILLGLVVCLTAGLADDAYMVGDKVYTAKFSVLADVNALDLDAIVADIDDAAGFKTGASVGYDYSDNKATAVIRVPNEVELDEQAVVGMFSNKYPDLEVTALNHSYTGASADMVYSLSVTFLLVIALVIAGVVSIVLCGVKKGLIVAGAAAHDALIVLAVYALARIAHLPLLVGALFMTIAISCALNTARIRALRVEKKKTRGEAADAALSENAGAATSLLILCFIIAAAFVAASLATGTVGLAYIAAMMLAVVLTVQYSSNLFMPAVWSLTK